MGLIRRADAQSMTRDAVALDLADLASRGQAVREQAEREAEKILAEARAERERLVTGAREEGFESGRAAGHAEGLEAGRAEGREAATAEWREKLAALDSAWARLAREFAAARESMLTEARTDVIRLAVLIAERVIKRSVEHDPSAVVTQMEEALALLSRRTRARVFVHPDDEALARDAAPALLAAFEKAEHLEIVPDESLARGSCVVRTGEGGVIDASIGSQLDGIARDLLPEDAEAAEERAGLVRPPGDEPGAEAA